MEAKRIFAPCGRAVVELSKKVEIHWEWINGNEGGIGFSRMLEAIQNLSFLNMP
jgi:hypothetical protein